MGVMPDNRAFPNSLLGWPGMNRPPSQRRGIDCPTVETSPAVPSMRCRYRSRTSPIVNATPSHTRDRGGIAEPVASFLAGSRARLRRANLAGHALRASSVGPRAAGGASRRPRAPHRYALTGYPARTQQRKRRKPVRSGCPPRALVRSPSQALATREARAWPRTPSARCAIPTGRVLTPVSLGSVPASQRVTRSSRPARSVRKPASGPMPESAPWGSLSTRSGRSRAVPRRANALFAGSQSAALLSRRAFNTSRAPLSTLTTMSPQAIAAHRSWPCSQALTA